MDDIIDEEHRERVVTKLHEVLRPFLLRRLKRVRARVYIVVVLSLGEEAGIDPALSSPPPTDSSSMRHNVHHPTSPTRHHPPNHTHKNRT